MKKITILFTTILSTLLLISCGGDNGSPNPEITGIQPESDPPGAAVTISGGWFQLHSFRKFR